MSAAHLQAMSIATSQVEVVVPAVLAHTKEKGDAQVPEERGERDEVEVAVVESVLLGMEDLGRHKKSLTQRWRIIGEQRRMARKLLLRLQLQMWRWWNKKNELFVDL